MDKLNTEYFEGSDWTNLVDGLCVECGVLLIHKMGPRRVVCPGCHDTYYNRLRQKDTYYGRPREKGETKKGK